MWLHILAFCGFYVGGAGQKMFNNATEVVLMRHGTTTVLAMENNYQGPPENFASILTWYSFLSLSSAPADSSASSSSIIRPGMSSG